MQRTVTVIDSNLSKFPVVINLDSLQHACAYKDLRTSQWYLQLYYENREQSINVRMREYAIGLVLEMMCQEYTRITVNIDEAFDTIDTDLREGNLTKALGLVKVVLTMDDDRASTWIDRRKEKLGL